jgi:hypothetical protein
MDCKLWNAGNGMIGRKQLSGVEEEIKSYFSKHWNNI